MTPIEPAFERAYPPGCPKCGKPSASPPAEVYCVECATEGWQDYGASGVVDLRVEDERGLA